MKRKAIKCPYCGAQAFLRPSSAVYGINARPGESLYVCSRYPACDSYVGAHRKSLLPMGSLANGDLRNKRIQAHKAFDRLWQNGIMEKWQAYQWMQAKFGLSSEQAHIAKFSEYMCDQLIHVCDQALENNRLAS
ncbi:zinc-finger-containing protein [Anaerocolumna xylanovorans]|uniref:Uncharacterized protein n=1 Tax=Anaerocolumna xylanovorans DSM 12503 TaxID=1121345 RepID=A0A1M7YNJ5_9FIRM|nr:zinc-finger-containing protein [Anaerocolumna xylanovorans]SHO54171.1 Protein of unknown function [Anaerocolumna xylanovorans DSM 12503]